MTLGLFTVGKTCRLICGDSAEVLRGLAPGSVDAVVTDPPSSIGFMGAEWDKDKGGRGRWVRWLRQILKLALAALKPGGHALVWALPRRSHWTALAVEVAGFEIRDVHHHLFGEGMPKSRHHLKPAVEHWIVGRKPFRGSRARCIERHGTGGLNIEACRIQTNDDLNGGAYAQTKTERDDGWGFNRASGREYVQPTGRWPANLSLDEFGAAALDEQSGVTKSGEFPAQRAGMGYKADGEGNRAGTIGTRRTMNDGGASRFFYIAKPADGEKTGDGQVDNDHPTVKSIALMSWLIRLVTPPGGVVLDPFAGSGTTGLACAAEGMSFVGVEQDPKFHETARRRLQLAFGAVETSL